MNGCRWTYLTFPEYFRILKHIICRAMYVFESTFYRWIHQCRYPIPYWIFILNTLRQLELGAWVIVKLMIYYLLFFPKQSKAINHLILRRVSYFAITLWRLLFRIILQLHCGSSLYFDHAARSKEKKPKNKKNNKK